MSGWVLIIIILSNGVAVEHVPFYTEESCLSAAEQIHTLSNRYVQTYCIERPTK